jgi:sec-independent protein translocase protein TatC
MSATFWEHFDELRRTLVRAFLVIGLGIFCAFFFYPTIFSFITKPLQTIAPTSALQHQEIKRERISNPTAHELTYKLLPDISIPVHLSSKVKEVAPGIFLIPQGGFLEIEKVHSPHELAIFGPIEGMAITLKTCFWFGLVGTSPVWMLLILRFIAPALRDHEQRLVIPFLLASLLFLFFGFLFAFFVTLPFANQYLYIFNQELGFNLWSLSHYLDYTIFLLLANGIAFELFVIVIFMIHSGFLEASTMSKKRKHVIVGAFILGALLTPPDIATQFMLAIPLIALYEIAILYACLREKLKTTSP